MKKMLMFGIVLLFLCSFVFSVDSNTLKKYAVNYQKMDNDCITDEIYGLTATITDSIAPVHNTSGNGVLNNYCYFGANSVIKYDLNSNILAGTSANGSIVFWHKFYGTVAENDEQIKIGSADQYGWRWFLKHTASNNAAFRIGDGTTITISTEVSPLTYADGNWHLWVATWNSNTFNIYYDNLSKNSNPASSINYNNNYSLYLGGNKDTNNEILGYIDEFVLFNKTLDTEEINFLWNDGNGRDLNGIEFNYPTPPDNTHNNTQVTINMTCETGNITLWFDSNGNPITKVVNQQTSPYSYITSVVTEGAYYYKGSCNNGAVNSSIRTWYYDTSAPTIIINTNNFFADDNSSLLLRNNTNKNLNITITDNIELYGFEINISKSGVTYYYNSSESLSGVSYNILNYVNFSNWTLGKYNVDLYVSDPHTDEIIENYITTEEKNKLDFKTEEGNHIWMITTTSSTTKTVKSIDRYSLEFTFDDKIISDKVIDLYSDQRINYLEKSKYQGHFVIWNSKTKKGNWVDFEGVNIKPTIVKITDYHYRLTFKNAESILKFNSIGGLNVEHETYSFNLTSYYPFNPSINVNNINVWNYSNEYSGKNNISINPTIINNILAGGCTCTDCVISSGVCRVPFEFYSLSQGRIKTTLLNASYSYGIDNCTNSFNIPSNATALNISFFNQLFVPTNVTYNSYLTYYQSNYSISNFYLSDVSYCIYPNWFNLSVNQQIQYNYDSAIYDYYLTNFLYNNLTQTLNLYTQNDTTQVLFTVLDRGNDLENAYIHILKYDVGTGTYLTSEIIKTDNQGQALGNIVLGTTFYNFLIYYDNELVYQENGVKLISTTRTFNINILGTSWLDMYSTSLGTNTNFYFNNGTYNFVFTWSDPTGNIHYGCLEVAKLNTSGTYIMYNNCSMTTSGTIVYNILPLNNGTEYIGTAYFKFDEENIIGRISYKVANIRSFFLQRPNDALFYGLLLTLILFLIGIPNPVISVTLLSFGIIISWMIGFWQLSLTNVGAIIVLILIQIYLAGRQNQ